MDVINTLNYEISERHLTEIEKLRYIYLRCCQLFYFDSRYSFNEVWNDGLGERISKRKIDLENVNDFSVICHSISKKVLKPLIEELIGLDCYVEGTKGHSYLEVEDSDGFIWSLDPSFGDLSRMKLDIYPTGMTGGYSDDRREMMNIDSDLGFEYKTKRDYLSLIEDISTKREKLRMIGYILDSTNAKYNYSDANYFLMMMLSFCPFEANTYSDKDYHFHKLVNISNDNYDGSLFYDLSKYNQKYSLKEIDEDKYLSLVKRLKHN